MANILVASFNTNGLRTPTKRSKIFSHFHQSQYDIILLQETHILPADIPQWKSEWKTPSYWNPGPTNQSCGVAILLNSHKTFKVIDTGHDNHGRVLTLTILYDTVYLQIICIYAPVQPSQRPRFFLSLPPFFRPNSTHIVGGDFNLVSNPLLDRTGSPPAPNHTQGLPQLNLLLQQFNLLDIWRFNHPNHKQYTWNSQKTNEPHIKSRLDVFFIPHTFSSQYIRNEFLPTVWSDHLYTTLHLPINPSIPRGANYWKLNTAVLSEPEYQQLITTLLNHRKTLLNQYDTVADWFQITKLHIKTVSQSYCRTRRRQHRTNIENLQKQINDLHATPPYDPIQMASMYTQLHHLQQSFNSGVIVRSREKQLLNEEKPTHYFFHQEQNKQRKKHITQIQSNTGVLHTDPRNILTILHDFYQQLYTRRHTSHTSQDYFLS